MKKLILILFISISFNGFSQCVDGNCDNGVGTYIWEDGSISNGTWKNGELNGIVQEITYDDKGRLVGTFDGEMEIGVINGWGTETLYDREGYLIGTYVGNWKNNEPNGWGIWIARDGTVEKGIYRNGELVN